MTYTKDMILWQIGHVGCFHAQFALFFLYFDQKKSVFTSKSYCCLQKQCQLCLIPLIHNTEEFHWSYYKFCCCRENGAWKMPLICRFLSHSGHFIATRCGNISMLSMSFLHIYQVNETKWNEILYKKTHFCLLSKQTCLWPLCRTCDIFMSQTHLHCLETREPIN